MYLSCLGQQKFELPFPAFVKSWNGICGTFRLCGPHPPRGARSSVSSMSTSPGPTRSAFRFDELKRQRRGEKNLSVPPPGEASRPLGCEASRPMAIQIHHRRLGTAWHCVVQTRMEFYLWNVKVVDFGIFQVLIVTPLSVLHWCSLVSLCFVVCLSSWAFESGICLTDS